MLEIRVTAVAPGQADGLSVAEQVAMALSGIGFRRDDAAPVGAGFAAPATSTPSVDEAVGDGDGPSGDAAVEDVAVQAGPTASEPAPRRRGRPRKEEAVAPPAGEAPSAPAVTAELEKRPSLQELADADQAAHLDAQEFVPQITANSESRAEPAPEAKRLTHEDLRSALGRLSQKVGLATAVAEVRALVGGGIQDVPDTQEALGAVLAKIEARIAGGGPLKDEAAEPAKTHDDVKAAIVDYAKRYGQDAAKVDWKVVADFSGRVDDMPADKLTAAVAAIAAATENNPFGRAWTDG